MLIRYINDYTSYSQRSLRFYFCSYFCHKYWLAGRQRWSTVQTGVETRVLTGTSSSIRFQPEAFVTAATERALSVVTQLRAAAVVCSAFVHILRNTSTSSSSSSSSSYLRDESLVLDSFKRSLKCFLFAMYWHSASSALEINSLMIARYISLHLKIIIIIIIIIYFAQTRAI